MLGRHPEPGPDSPNTEANLNWLVSALLLLLGTAVPAGAVTVDGRIQAGEYAFVYAVDYEYGPNNIPVSGGILAFDQAANGDLHLYYQAPTDLVDNTWGCEVGDGPSCSQIGQYVLDPHTFQELWRSDSFGTVGNKMEVRNSTAGNIRFSVDLLSSALGTTEAVGSGAQQFQSGGFGADWLGQALKQNEGSIQNFPQNGQFFLEAATSTEWNLLHFGPGGTGAISQQDLDSAMAFRYKDRFGVFRDSPATDANYSDPTSDNPVAPQALTLYDDSDFSGWQYQIAMEIVLDGALFANGEWIDPLNHVIIACPDGDNCLPILDLGAAHFSRDKLGLSSRLNPISLTRTVITPEPQLMLLLAASLGLALGRRASL